jgi:CheY-like chemotaxis protein
MVAVKEAVESARWIKEFTSLFPSACAECELSDAVELIAMNESSKSANPSGPRRVLFVDDDVTFLKTVQELMSTLSEGNWEVLAAESASRAFALMHEQAVDLVVIDVQMSVMDGIQMLALLNRGHPNVQKVVLTGHSSEKYRTACLSNGAELFLEKPTNPAGWQNLYAVLNEFVKFRPEEGFRGVLRRVGLQDVIQMECLARSSSVLEISNRLATGKIYIDTGQIIHAQVGSATGEKAFNQLMSLSGGQFNLRPFAEPPERSLSGQWEFLLMEAARKSDEAKEAAAQLPVSPLDAPGTAAEYFAARPLEAMPRPPQPDSPAETPPALPLAPMPPSGVPSRPKVDELLVCSAQGEVLYQWQCRHVDLWVNFFEYISQRGQRLAQSLPLGNFDRLEIESGGARAVVIISDDRGVMVKSRREPLNA